MGKDEADVASMVNNEPSVDLREGSENQGPECQLWEKRSLLANVVLFGISFRTIHLTPSTKMDTTSDSSISFVLSNSLIIAGTAGAMIAVKCH